MPRSARMKGRTRAGADAGSGAGKSGLGSGSRTSNASGAPSGGSTRRWRKPTSVKEFAAQANAVATLLLNGELDVEIARAYSGIARTVAAAISNETSRARFAKTAPDLSLGDDVYEVAVGVAPGAQQGPPANALPPGALVWRPKG